MHLYNCISVNLQGHSSDATLQCNASCLLVRDMVPLMHLHMAPLMHLHMVPLMHLHIESIRAAIILELFSYQHARLPQLWMCA